MHFNIFTEWARVELGENGLWGLQRFSFMVERDFFNFGEAGFFHVCTDGGALPWMFQDNKDFISGVNRIGVCSFLSNVKVVSFVLMDNHVHFVLQGTMPSCKEFITRYKHLTGKYIYSRYSIKGHIRGVSARIIPIVDNDNLRAVISYIDRNPVVAGYKSLPVEYPWGSARYVFRENPETCKEKMLVIGTIPVRQRDRLLGTRVILPEDWQVDSSGMIYPPCFFDGGIIEAVFKSPTSYIYHLAKKMEGEIDAVICSGSRSFIPDKELRPVVMQLAADMFGNSDIRILNLSSRLMIARKLRYEYASTHKQIARMLHLDVEMLRGYV